MLTGMIAILCIFKIFVGSTFYIPKCKSVNEYGICLIYKNSLISFDFY